MTRRHLSAAPWAFCTLLLAAAAVASVTLEGFDWGAEDFVAAALLLSGGCVGLEIARRTISSRTGRILAAGFVITCVLFIWAELAVGVFGA